MIVAFTAFTLATAFWLATAGVFFRDTRDILEVVLPILFWATPLFYSPQMAPPFLQPILWVNPLTSFLGAMRTAVLDGQAPAMAQLGLIVFWVIAALLSSFPIFVALSAPFRRGAVMAPAIECRDVSKAFVLRTNRQYLLKERVLGLFRPHLREGRQHFWALHDVSFTVEAGEMFGVIGPNGAGKTTLLRIIAGIFQPTSGTVRTSGRMAPLLGLGVGFHPELTGRENIYMGAAMFGFTTREITALEGTIIDFAEIGQFIDVPVKNYSSGMQVRLGFAIALEVRPDIFLIDEVLSAGDERFRRKCLKRLKRERTTGRTYLIASHNLTSSRTSVSARPWC